MRNIWTVFKKEIYRVISDKRLVLMIFIVPGLSIYVMYSLMGTIIGDQVSQVEEHQIILYESHMPDGLKTMLEGLEDSASEPLNIVINSAEGLSETALIEGVREGDIDIALVFDEGFEDALIAYQTTQPPMIDVYYDYGRQTSSFAHGRVMAVVNTYRELVLINRLDNPEHYDVFSTNTIEGIADDRQVAGRVMAMLMPMLIIIFLFAGAMSIGPDSIAGEKERNTIATLLVTPIKRREIALGKVTSLATLSLMSALSSFIGITLSIPKLMTPGQENPDLNIYTMSEYLAILFILIATVLLIVGLISVISAYAKTIKEASMLIMPFYFVTLIIGIVTSFGVDPLQQAWVHMIPIYGAVNLLSGVFVFEWTMMNMMIVIVSSLVYTSVFVYVLTLMFNSEKVMFQK